MMLERNTIKQESKRLMAVSQPAAWLVTLVYLISTSWVSNAAELLNPTAQALSELNVRLQNAYLAMDESGVEAVMLSLQQMMQKPSFFATVLAGVVLALYAIVVEFGYLSYALQVTRGEESGYRELFSRFYMAGKIIAAVLLMGLFVGLWSILFILPGIIAAYRYRMVPFLLLDDPELSVWKAIQRSKEMMQGRKMELFSLDLSFLPWFLGEYLLANGVYALAGGRIGLVLGLAVSTACYLYLLPYLQFTYAQWYQAVYTETGLSQTPAQGQ